MSEAIATSTHSYLDTSIENPGASAPTKPADQTAPDAATPRKSAPYDQRRQSSVYYDSRAATRHEYRRRASTLEEYYTQNPHLLPQLPFTWHHGSKRWRLGALIGLIFIDACVLPVVLYYALRYVANVQGFIIFAIITTIWGGPTYLELAIRTLRLVKKERFYRPLGTNSRWSFDLTTWISVISITAVTALFVVGSAPHIVWLRVLCMPAPAILYSFGGSLALITLYHSAGWKAPFRMSSTAKGEQVLPAVYYLVEDVMAVNAGAGRPYREALAARYRASARFRRMLRNQSIFWATPPILIAIPLTVIAILPEIPATIAYGICWTIPFLWAGLWSVISVIWCKADLRQERERWDTERHIDAQRHG